MQNVRDADLLRREAFREIGSWRSRNEKAVAKARKLLEEFKEQNRALDVRLTPLTNSIRAGNEFLVDEVLEFLAVDILAFGCGYAKEKCYRRLKHVELSPSQVGLIKDIALKRCASDEYRREDAELRRLITKLADLEFLEKVAAIPARDGSRVFEHRKRMFQSILAVRKDLRGAFERKAKGSNT
jgi:hypothetical protein